MKKNIYDYITALEEGCTLNRADIRDLLYDVLHHMNKLEAANDQVLQSWLEAQQQRDNIYRLAANPQNRLTAQYVEYLNSLEPPKDNAGYKMNVFTDV